MSLPYSRLLSRGLAFVTILVFITIAIANNQDGAYKERVCAEFSGPTRTDPRSGEGPECDRYEMVTRKESPTRSALRGLADGVMPAIIMGFLGLFVGDQLDERAKRHSSQEDDHRSE